VRDEFSDSSRDECHFADLCPNLRDESPDSLRAPRTQPVFVEFCPYVRDEFSDSSRDECHFADLCPNLRDESPDSLRAPRTQPIFVEFCPYVRDEFPDSSRDKWQFDHFDPGRAQNLSPPAFRLLFDRCRIAVFSFDYVM
jgi:hypothetical protein